MNHPKRQSSGAGQASTSKREAIPPPPSSSSSLSSNLSSAGSLASNSSSSATDFQSGPRKVFLIVDDVQALPGAEESNLPPGVFSREHARSVMYKKKKRLISRHSDYDEAYVVICGTGIRNIAHFESKDTQRILEEFRLYFEATGKPNRSGVIFLGKKEVSSQKPYLEPFFQSHRIRTVRAENFWEELEDLRNAPPLPVDTSLIAEPMNTAKILLWFLALTTAIMFCWWMFELIESKAVELRRVTRIIKEAPPSELRNEVLKVLHQYPEGKDVIVPQVLPEPCISSKVRRKMGLQDFWNQNLTCSKFDSPIAHDRLTCPAPLYFVTQPSVLNPPSDWISHTPRHYTEVEKEFEAGMPRPQPFETEKTGPVSSGKVKMTRRRFEPQILEPQKLQRTYKKLQPESVSKQKVFEPKVREYGPQVRPITFQEEIDREHRVYFGPKRREEVEAEEGQGIWAGAKEKIFEAKEKIIEVKDAAKDKIIEVKERLFDNEEPDRVYYGPENNPLLKSQQPITQQKPIIQQKPITQQQNLPTSKVLSNKEELKEKVIEVKDAAKEKLIGAKEKIIEAKDNFMASKSPTQPSQKPLTSKPITSSSPQKNATSSLPLREQIMRKKMENQEDGNQRVYEPTITGKLTEVKDKVVGAAEKILESAQPATQKLYEAKEMVKEKLYEAKDAFFEPKPTQDRREAQEKLSEAKGKLTEAKDQAKGKYYQAKEEYYESPSQRVYYGPNYEPKIQPSQQPPQEERLYWKQPSQAQFKPQPQPQARPQPQPRHESYRVHQTFRVPESAGPKIVKEEFAYPMDQSEDGKVIRFHFEGKGAKGASKEIKGKDKKHAKKEKDSYGKESKHKKHGKK